MPQFNKDQIKAVQAENASLLISAAAGSGKTTVMVSRIVRELMRLDVPIDRFLVITFTRDAADHMRRKLEEALEEASRNPEFDETGRSRARKALLGIDNAAISTIHAFCLNTIREYFDVSGVSAEVRTLEEDRKNEMLSEAYENAVEELFAPRRERDRDDMENVRILFQSMTQEEVREAVSELYETVMGLPDPFETLERIVSHGEGLWRNEILSALQMDLEEVSVLHEQICGFLNNPMVPQECCSVLEKDAECLEEFLRIMAETAEESEQIRLLEDMPARFSSLTVKNVSLESKNVYEAVKKTRERLKNKGNIFSEAADALKMIRPDFQKKERERTQREIAGLILVLKKTAELYRKAKQDADTIDFSDMEQMTYELLKQDGIREEILQRYTEIYVDETQDISAIQNAILTCFETDGHHLFMVGDIKQSIYRFRHAEPEFFDRKRRNYSDEETASCRRIFFQDNYRSCRAVIECVNEVFRNCMDRRITELDYTPEDELRANQTGEFGPVEIHLIGKEHLDEESDALSAQCAEAADIIRRLLTEGYRYRDIAILLRSARTDAPKMTEIFRKMHIPVFYNGPQSFFGLREITQFLNLLTTILNERSDIELYGTLKNVPFLFTDEELADIRLAHRDGDFWEAWIFCAERNLLDVDRRCREARDQLQIWRKRARELTASEMIWELMRETGYYALRGAYPEGRLRQANLDALYHKALKLEERGILRLDDFLDEMRRIQISEKKGDDAAAAFSDEDDLVRIMTMHGSKGLEFPVVILMNLQKSFLSREIKTPIRIDMSGPAPLGIYLPAVNRQKHIRTHTFGKRAFEIRAKRNELAEETRLLYVAMTRAERKLIMTAVYREKDLDAWTMDRKILRIWKSKSMLDMIMPTVLEKTKIPDSGQESRGGDWLVVNKSRTLMQKEPDGVSEDFSIALEKILKLKISENPDGIWLPEAIQPEPAKTSVTAMVHTQMEHEEEETAEGKSRTERVLTPFRLSSVPDKPAFLVDEDHGAAEIGTATHRFLRLIPLNLFANGKEIGTAVHEAIALLTSEKRLTDEEAGLISAEQVEAFFRSDLGRRLIRAEKLEREWPFTMRINKEKGSLIQGVIDAAFMENGAWVLIDYKTDWDTSEKTFVARHEKQMNWYRIAVERLSGIPVREMWLVALIR